MRVGLVCNPSAGGGKAATTAARAQTRLHARGIDVTLRNTSAPGEASAITQELARDVDVVVAVGGDGTVNEVVNGLADTDMPLGIVPAGTVNVLALELGIPFDVERACDVIVAGRTLPLDVGTANGRRFTLMLGAGIDAMTVHELDPLAKRRFGRLAFVSTGVLSRIRYPQPDFEVDVDGHTFPATFAVVGNSRFYGGRFGVTTEADPTDGVFDVLVYYGQSVAADALFWMGVPLELHLGHPGVTYLRGAKVTLRPLEPDDVVWFQTDGELAGTLPATAVIEQRALQVFVPGAPLEREKGDT
jgi:lipid kinase, YegS/Rv2252/BmrU family